MGLWTVSLGGQKRRGPRRMGSSRHINWHLWLSSISWVECHRSTWRLWGVML